MKLLSQFRNFALISFAMLASCDAPKVEPQINVISKQKSPSIQPSAGTYTIKILEQSAMGQVLNSGNTEGEPITIDAQNAAIWPQPYILNIMGQLIPKMPTNQKQACRSEDFAYEGDGFKGTAICGDGATPLDTKAIYTGSISADSFDILMTLYPPANGGIGSELRYVIHGEIKH